MISVSKDVVALIYHLLPGFVTAWIFYGLTSHPKSSSFERVVQALIFTALIQAIVIPTGVIFLWLGQWGTLGVVRVQGVAHTEPPCRYQLAGLSRIGVENNLIENPLL